MFLGGGGRAILKRGGGAEPGGVGVAEGETEGGTEDDEELRALEEGERVCILCGSAGTSEEGEGETEGDTEEGGGTREPKTLVTMTGLEGAGGVEPGGGGVVAAGVSDGTSSVRGAGATLRGASLGCIRVNFMNNKVIK